MTSREARTGEENGVGRRVIQRWARGAAADVHRQMAVILEVELARQQATLEMLEALASFESLSPLEEELLTACQAGTLGEIEQLLDSGADVNRVGSNGLFPLAFAVIAREPNEAVVSLLLERDADPNAALWNGWSLLHYVALRDRSDLVALLVGAGAEVDARDQSGATPLHFAAYHGNEAAARALLAVGATRSLQGWEGATRNKKPFDLARPHALRDLLRA